MNATSVGSRTASRIKRIGAAPRLAIGLLMVLGACQPQSSASSAPGTAVSSGTASPSANEVMTTDSLPSSAPPAPAPTPVPTTVTSGSGVSIVRLVRDAIDASAPGSMVAVEETTKGDVRVAGIIVAPATRDDVLHAVLAVDGARAVDVSGLVDEPRPTIDVRPGDTMWSIAELVYGDSGLWRVIANANPGVDPRSLVIGSELVIPRPRSGSQQLSWDPAAEFLTDAAATNPGPDAHGNTGVWGYLFNTGFDHDPSGYASMPTTDGHMWLDPAYLYLIVGKDAIPGTMRMHGYGGRVVNSIRTPILAWHAPISGLVHASGTFTVGDPACNQLGSGVIFTIDQGSRTLYAAVPQAGAAVGFDLWTRITDTESLYVTLDPGFDSLCDTTLMRLRISSL